jgi:hypothetical protein
VFNPIEDGDLFTVRVIHNGFFCGLRDNLEYVDSTVDNFELCSAATWSMLQLDEILEILGYQRDGRLHVYWCLPNTDIRKWLSSS